MWTYTDQQLALAITTCGHYRIGHAGDEALKAGIPQEVIVALGLRETGLRNIEGGAKLVNGSWVKQDDPHLMDAGFLQISRLYHPDALKGMPGVRVGTWTPTVKGKTANDGGYVPRYSDSLAFTLRSMVASMQFAADHGVPKAHRLRFAIAAHNAGTGGALIGWKAGNVDQRTAGGDYSAWVLEHAARVKTWIAAHPNWRTAA